MNNQLISPHKAHIARWVSDLGSEDGLVRQRARLQLENFSPASIPALLEALQSTKDLVRREAVQALGEIRNPDTSTELTEMLMDENISVRWAAMEGLIHMGRDALRPMLNIYIKNFESIWMREGILHILRVFNDRHILQEPEILLFQELDKQFIPGFGSIWTSQQAWAAEKALEKLDREESQSR